MAGVIAQMASAFRADAVNVLMAHVFTDGALVTPGGGERELHIGMAYAIPPSRLPADASYIALGHVHKPQSVKGSPAPTRYAGSLLQLDFGEAAQDKSVVIVEAEPGMPAKVRAVPISGGRPLKDLRGTVEDIESLAGSVADAWLRVFVQTDGPSPGVADRIHELLPNAVAVHLEYERADADPQADAAVIASLTPHQQFDLYYRSEHGAAPPPALLDAFDGVLAEDVEDA